MSSDMGQFIIDHLLFDFDFFSPFLMFRFLEILKYKWIFGVAGSWISRRKCCRNFSQHFWSRAKHNTCPYRKKCRRAQLELGGEKKNKISKYHPPLQQTLSWGRHFPLPFIFLLHFLLLFNSRFLHVAIPPCKLRGKHFQLSNNITKCAAF